MKILTALVVIGTAFFLARTRYLLNQWEDKLQVFETKLLQQPPLAVTAKQSWEDLPAVVQRYLTKVLPPSSEHRRRGIANVRFHQVGDYKLGSRWLPMQANEFLSTNPPGLVWDATIATLPFLRYWPYVQVCDAWAYDGEAYRNVAWVLGDMLEDYGGAHEEESSLMGPKTLRWLAETIFVPTILSPEEGLVTWSSSSSDADDDDTTTTALLTLAPDAFQFPTTTRHDTTTPMTLKATFDRDTGFLIQLEGLRPHWTGEEFVLKKWQGHYSDYERTQEVDGNFWIPTHMESGFVHDDNDDQPLELYFKGTIILMEIHGNEESLLRNKEDASTKTE